MDFDDKCFARLDEIFGLAGLEDIDSGNFIDTAADFVIVLAVSPTAASFRMDIPFALPAHQALRCRLFVSDGHSLVDRRFRIDGLLRGNRNGRLR